ncbi:MAG: zinc ribbon domain-containing protein, partial [Gemmatimonadota bacterium]
LHLLGDETQAEIQEERLDAAIQSELLSAEPALRFLRRFAASEVKLKSAVVTGRSNDSEGTASTTNGAGSVQGPRLHGTESGPPSSSRRKSHWPPPSDAEAPTEAEAATMPAPPEAAQKSASVGAPGATRRKQQSASRGGAPASANQGCRSCQEELPDVADLRFCPHCGTDQNRWDCNECQAEIQRPWRFCPKCGAGQPVS